MQEAKLILVMGVCGVGKSLVARAVADALGAEFVEADDFHSPQNIARMKDGKPLSDEMRFGWLDAIGDTIAGKSERAVLACSALKQRYRDRLSARAGDILIIHLVGSPELLEQRVSNRPGHFMPASLVSSQFADLEPPQGAMVEEIDVALPPQAVIARALGFIRGHSENSSH